MRVRGVWWCSVVGGVSSLTPHRHVHQTHAHTHTQDERSAVAYFPRGKRFLVQLSGTATPFAGEDDEAVEEDEYGASSSVAMAMVAAEEGGRVAVTVDLRSEVRRGEAVRVGEEWFRVSTLEDR